MRPLRHWAPYVYDNFGEAVPVVIVLPVTVLVWLLTVIVRVFVLCVLIPANAEWPNHRMNNWHEFFRFEIDGMG